ncbi:MAG: hypothetical protein H7839_14485 [Magnetococcus sp. YQC-5]
MSLKDRLELLNLDCFSDSDQEIVIKEKAAEGKATLLLKVARRCLALHDADTRKISYLKNQKVADCIMLELEGERAVALHVFELKRTITSKTWPSIQTQFSGAFHNALGLLGVLGLAVPEKIFFYAAFCRDNLVTAPVSSKMLINQEDPITENARIVKNWHQETIDIAWAKDPQLKKIQWNWENMSPYSYILPSTQSCMTVTATRI